MSRYEHSGEHGQAGDTGNEPGSLPDTDASADSPLKPRPGPDSKARLRRGAGPGTPGGLSDHGSETDFSALPHIAGKDGRLTGRPGSHPSLSQPPSADASEPDDDLVINEASDNGAVSGQLPTEGMVPTDLTSATFNNVDSSFPTRDQWQEARQLLVSRVINRFGDSHVSGLGEAFDRNAEPSEIVSGHLFNIKLNLLSVHDDVHTTEVLCGPVANAVDNPIVTSSAVSGNAIEDLHSRNGLRIGNIAVSFTDGAYSTRKIDQELGQVRAGGLQDEYQVIPDTSDGFIAVSTSCPERYRGTVDEQGKPHIYHEAVLSISQDDASRFAEYGQDLKTYQTLLLQAIDEAGVNISSVRTKLENGDRLQNEDFDLLQDASDRVRDYYATHRSPIVDQLEIQAALLMSTRNEDSFTTDGRIRGMYSVVRDIRTYFETVNMAGLDRGYHRW